MAGSAIATALVGLVLLIAPSAAGAVPVADAGCPGPSNGSFAPLGDRREAQTFVPSHSGALQRVTLAINNISPADPDFLVQILATDSREFPVNTALASATIPKTSVPGGASTLDIGFSSPAVVSAGRVYAVTISRPGANFLLPTWLLAVQAPGSCGGNSFYSLGATSGWALEPSRADIIYQTYVEPLQVTQTGGSAGFSLLNKHGRLFARVPGPGKLVVDDAKHSKGPGLVRHTKRRARRAGDVQLRVELTAKAIRRVLKTRKLNTRAAVTYRPTGGTPSTLTFRIRIKL